MLETLVSTKYQIVIPKKIRKAVKIKPGQKLYAYAVEGQIILTLKKKWPEDYLKELKGLWGGIDVAKYLDEERSWE